MLHNNRGRNVIQECIDNREQYSKKYNDFILQGGYNIQAVALKLNSGNPHSELSKTFGISR